MRRLTIFVLILAALYSGYWFIGAGTVEGQARDALTDLQNNGWDVEYDELDTRGFPSRFDTTITNLRLEDPDGLIEWTAPFVQAFALSYQPNKLIAVFPNEQTLRIDQETIDVSSDGFRASGAVGAQTSLPLRDATVEAANLMISSDNGWSIDMNMFVAALRPATDKDTTYLGYISAADLRLPLPQIAQMAAAPESPVGETIDQFVFESIITLDRDIELNAGPGAPPALTAYEVRNFDVTWGSLGISANGTLTPSASGSVDGALTVTITNWSGWLTTATAAGLIDAQTATSYASMAQGMAAGEDNLTLPLSIRDGAVSMGFIPLGTIPNL